MVMGRTLDLPSVIELAPCKYKRGIIFGRVHWAITKKKQ
jgi:hypothetical protein